MPRSWQEVARIIEMHELAILGGRKVPDDLPYLEVIFSGVGPARRVQVLSIRIGSAYCGIAMHKRTWVHRGWLETVMRTGKVRAVVLQESDTRPVEI